MANPKKNERILIYKIIGGILAIFLVGLFFDAVRTYWLRKRVEFAVRAAGLEIAQRFLPWNPAGVRGEGPEMLKAHDLITDINSIAMSPTGDSLTVSARGEATPFFAWIVGETKFTFRTGTTVRVLIPNARPAGALPADSVAFFLTPPEDLRLDDRTLLWPSDTALPDFAIPVFLAAGPSPEGIRKIGDPVTLQPAGDLSAWRGKEVYVGLSTKPSEGGAYLVGFAFFRGGSLDEQGRLEGTFARHGINPGAGSAWGIPSSGSSYGLIFCDPVSFVQE